MAGRGNRPPPSLSPGFHPGLTCFSPLASKATSMNLVYRSLFFTYLGVRRTSHTSLTTGTLCTDTPAEDSADPCHLDGRFMGSVAKTAALAPNRATHLAGSVQNLIQRVFHDPFCPDLLQPRNEVPDHLLFYHGIDSKPSLTGKLRYSQPL